MPRLNHTKSRNGCVRCKRRKVKCDEVHPRCGQCEKHDLSCEYTNGTKTQIAPQSAPAPVPEASPPSNLYNNESAALLAEKERLDAWGLLTPESLPDADPRLDNVSDLTPLELRLIHYFVLYTSRSFSVNEDWWSIRVPLLAWKHRCVLDGLLALAALHLHRISDAGVIGEQHRAKDGLLDSEEFLEGATSADMLRISVHYLHSAIRAHRTVFESFQRDAMKVVWTSSIPIMILTLFMLGETDEPRGSLGLDTFDEKLWLRLGIGPRDLVPIWTSQLGLNRDILVEIGARNNEPDLSDTATLYRPENAAPFQALLTFALDFEVQQPEDTETYSNLVAYVGLMYTTYIERAEARLSTSRRLISFPARAPPRFLDMVLLNKPRALAILLHMYAIMKLLADDIPWYTGIAEKQMPGVIDRLPTGWRPVCQWPMAILERPYNSDEPIPPLPPPE